MRLQLLIVAIFAIFVSNVYGQASIHNFQADFDKVLFLFVQEHIRVAEEALFNANEDVLLYTHQDPKDADLKAKIVREVTERIAILQMTSLETTGQLKRGDFSDFEKYLAEKLHSDVILLEKYLKSLLTKI